MKDVKTVAEIEEVMTKKVIYFSAPWCAPCKKFAPEYEAWEKKYNEEATFFKVNIDIAPELVAKYKVSAIPLVVVQNGKKIRLEKNSEAELIAALEAL